MISETLPKMRLILQCHAIIDERSPKKEVVGSFKMQINEFVSQDFKKIVFPHGISELKLKGDLFYWKEQYILAKAQTAFSTIDVIAAHFFSKIQMDFDLVTNSFLESVRQFSEIEDDPQALVEQIDDVVSFFFENETKVNPERWKVRIRRTDFSSSRIIHEIDLIIGMMFHQTLNPITKMSWITHLTLFGNLFARPRLTEILSSCPNLESLTIKQVDEYDLIERQECYSLSTEDTFRYWPADLRCMLISCEYNQARDLALAITASTRIAGKPLKEISLQNCNWANLALVRQLIIQNPAIEYFSCIDCQHFEVQALDDLASKILHLSFYSDDLPQMLRATIEKTASSLRTFTVSRDYFKKYRYDF